MRFYKISEEVRNALIAYLLTRPMQEVEHGVNALRYLDEVPANYPEILTKKSTPVNDPE